MIRDIQAEILADLAPGDISPDPERIATALCGHCRFPIVRETVSTGRQFRGPYWMEAWVHTDTKKQACWTPNAYPDIDPHQEDTSTSNPYNQGGDPHPGDAYY